MLTAQQYNASPAKLQIGDLIVGRNLSKSAQVTTSDDKQIALMLGTATDPVAAPFGLSQWGSDPTDRVSLDLRTTPEIEQCIQKIDETILNYVEQHAKKYFGANATKEKVREWFRPTVKIHEEGKYDPLVKCKLSKSRVKVWTPTNEPGSVEDLVAHSQLRVALLVRSCYFQSKGWGVTLEVTNVKLADSAVECPFEDECGEWE